MSEYLKKAPTPLFDTLDQLNSLQQDFYTADLYAIPHSREDYFHASQFLRAYRGSEATFNAYRREIERLLQWCWLVAAKSLQQIKRNDIEAFVEFCQKPPMPWIGTKNVPRFLERNGERKPNPEWRPFVTTVSKVAHSKGESADPKKYHPSQKALQAIFAIIGSFYSYLLQEEYVENNPIAQIRQKSKFLRKYQSAPMIRRLSEIQWHYVMETAQGLADANPDQHERTLFIMSILYGMYL